MKKFQKLTNTIRLIVVFQMLISIIAPMGVAASAPQEIYPDFGPGEIQLPELETLTESGEQAANPYTEISAQAALTPTLEVDILGAPLVPNDPNEIGPEVFVVHAQVVNTGTVTATIVTLSLDFADDPGTGWMLLNNEVEERSKSQLDPGNTFNGYWFATYPTEEGETHQYTVTVTADSFDPITAVGTVTVVDANDTGNNFQERSGAEVTVGVSFAITVTYNLGTNHNVASFSPAGNPDFQPGDYRLISTKTDFFDDSQILVDTFYDQLYFPTILPDYETATTLYEFTALSPTDTRLCPYTWLRIKEEPEDPYKYDNNYCDEPHTLPITGTISVEMDKIASHETILQGETITYTINYTNNGTIPLQYAWIWDDVDPAFASVLTDTLVPAGDPTWTDEHRAAWYPDNIGAVGDEPPPPRSGTVSFSAVVDGGGNDLADGDILVNVGKFGITEGRLPETVALTATSSTTIMAPTIVPTKTDGQDTVEPGTTYTYTLQVENVGSEIAENLIITDTLPMYLTLAGTPQPITHTIVGNQIVWDGLGSLSFGDPPLEFTIPVELDIKAPDQHVITNTMHVGYANRIGHIYNPAEGTDATTVNGPVLTIDKTESQDPVLVASELTYEVAYSNDGHGIATGVVISDVIPADTSFEGKCSDSCNYDAPTGVITWTITSLSPGASGTVTFTVRVSDLLQTGDIITNEDYGIYADQLDFTAGEPVTTTAELEAAIIQGKAFVDDNVNGILDVGEVVGIENVEVTLPDALVPVKYTDAEGDYSFRVEVQKAISLTAGLPAGYFRTTPGTVYLDAMLGVTDTVVNFGYAPVTSTWGAAYVTVFEDTNYNSTQDLGENGIPGVEVTSTLAITSPLTTAAHGQVTFRYEVTSTATITETDPAGYISTTPNVLEVEVEPGTGQSVYFGDFPGIMMSGMVFEDLDVDGENDGPPEELGLPDAVISSGTTSYTTTVTGAYTMYLPVDGSPIEITELDPPGYLSTNAVPGTDVTSVDANTLMILTPTAGTQYTGDFGDVEATGAITISGWVWNDNGEGDGGIMANGLKEDGEPYLGGAIVELSSGLTQTTATDGAFLLYAPPGIVVTVTEQNPPGYISTDAIPGEGTGVIRVDKDTLVVPALNPGDTSAGHLFGDVLITSTAIITGYVFDDTNENGVKDLAENGFEGVTVTLEINGGVSIPTLTDSNGVYQFAVAPGTDVQITSSGPGGDYYPTTPESVFLRPPTAGNFGNNNFGYSDDYEVAVILGTVFDDVNGNGSREFGELGLPGAVISLTLDGSLVYSYTTTGTGVITGTYVFSVPLPAEGESIFYRVHETNPDGYRSTTPDDVNVNVTSAKLSYQVDFGDTIAGGEEIATIYGTVFHDRNSNGIIDTDETGIEEVLITLDGVYTTTTDLHGAYAFSTTITGTHTVVEKDPTGYISTTPNEVHVEVNLGESYQVDFGDTIRDPGDFAVIYGTVFHDSNGNGIFDASELGIEGVLITLDGLYTDTTDIYGAYTFSTTITGTHTVVEKDPEGYFSTTPNEVHPTVELGDEFQVDFGDALKGVDEFASIYGAVFHDVNQNATWDSDEPGIPGVEITLDGSITATTGVYGSYTFSTTITGLHTVVEKDPPKHISTTPNVVDVPGVVLGENYQVNFGDKYQEFILIYFPIIFSGSVPPEILLYFPLVER
jgi:uncharacterized repeat protein (TIGR01451 family)